MTMIEEIKKILAENPEPIGAWMREEGHPPEQWRLVLPVSMARPGLPEYVWTSPLIERPIFIRRSEFI